MPTLQPHVIDYPRLTVGTLADLSVRLHTELLQAGYSLLLDDVQDTLRDAATLYAGWASFEVQRYANSAIQLDLTLEIDAYEWAMIEPVCRAHCTLMQARRMEGSQALNGQTFGIGVSEAESAYTAAREALPKMAFIAEPYTIDLA